MPEAAPVKVMAGVTLIPLPTIADANMPVVAVANVTTSDPTIPESMPPEIEAAVVPSYTLFVTLAPVTVSALVVILAVNAGWVTA